MVSEFEFHDRHTIAHNGDFHAVMDELRRPSDRPSGFDQLLVAHIDFYHFDKAALQRLLREWSIFRSVVTAPLFAFCTDGEEDSRKWERFVRLLGFEELPDAVLPASDGSSRRIFVSAKAIDEPKAIYELNHHRVSLGPASPVPDAGVSERTE